MAEYINVEKPFLDKLRHLGWTVINQGQGVIAIIYYPADELLFSFLLLTSTSVFQIGCGSGLDIQ